MNRKMIGIVILASMVSGFLGGLISSASLHPSGKGVAQNGPIPENIMARKVTILDSKGNVGMILRPYKMDIFDNDLEIEGGIHLYDGNGTLATILNQTGLILNGSKGSKGNIMLYMLGGLPTLEFTSPGITPSGGCCLPLRREALGLDQDGKPYITLNDRKQNIRASIGSISLQTIKTGDITQTSESSIVLFDKKGKVFWEVP